MSTEPNQKLPVNPWARAAAANPSIIEENEELKPDRVSLSSFKTAAGDGYFFCTLTFGNMHEERNASKLLEDSRFPVEDKKGGSEITFRIHSNAVHAFSWRLKELGFDVMAEKDRVFYIDGKRTDKCKTPKQAMRLALGQS